MYMCAYRRSVYYLLCDALLKTDPEQRESEHPDSDLIWNLQLMAQVMCTNALHKVVYTRKHDYYEISIIMCLCVLSN